MRNGYCVRLEINGINDWDCNSDNFVLCESSGQALTNHVIWNRPSLSVFTCPPGWSFNDGYCYFVSSYQMTFAQAQAYCPSTDSRAYLVQINSQEEHDFIMSILPDSTWVSLFYL